MKRSSLSAVWADEEVVPERKESAPVQQDTSRFLSGY